MELCLLSATNPQKMRIHLPHAAAGEKMVLKIYYQSSQRLQVFVGDRFVEDLNMLDGQMKKQLVKDGKWSSNNDDGTYDRQLVDSACSCRLESQVSCVASKCFNSPGNEHGANSFNRRTGMLELVVGQHGVEGKLPNLENADVVGWRGMRRQPS